MIIQQPYHLATDPGVTVGTHHIRHLNIPVIGVTSLAPTLLLALATSVLAEMISTAPLVVVVHANYSNPLRPDRSKIQTMADCHRTSTYRLDHSRIQTTAV